MTPTIWWMCHSILSISKRKPRPRLCQDDTLLLFLSACSLLGELGGPSFLLWGIYTAFLINDISGSLYFPSKCGKHLSHQLNCKIVAKPEPGQVNHSPVRTALKKGNNLGWMINKRRIYVQCLLDERPKVLHAFFCSVFSYLITILHWASHSLGHVYSPCFKRNVAARLSNTF